MAKKNLMAKLLAMDGAVSNEAADMHSTVIQTPSPSLNFIYGNGHGLPLGSTAILYGPPKAGKSVISNMMIGQMHKDYKDGFAIKFDTEFRERGQMNSKTAQMYGVDRSRYVCYSTNDPGQIFDRIEKDFPALIDDEGMDLKLVIIDSVSSILGRREKNSDSVENQLIGDHAQTVQIGLKRILPIQRKYNFAIVLTAQARAEMDMIEQKRGNKIKMQAGFGLQHFAEYFILVQPNKNADSRQDLAGHKLADESVTDLNNKNEQTAHKIKVQMRDSSYGPKGRNAEFTLDYQRGVINTHEEVFLLGKNRGILERPNNTTYSFQGKDYRGVPAMLEAIRKDPQLAADILTELRRRDNEGYFTAQDSADAATVFEESAELEESSD